MNYLNFAPLLNQIFELGFDNDMDDEPGYQTYKLSNNEKMLIYTLAKHPNATVAEISTESKLSVPTVCKLRKFLLDRGVIKQINIPVLQKIGIELIVLNLFKRNSLHNNEMRHLRRVKNPHTYLSLASSLDFMTLSLYKNYTEYQECRNKYKLDFGGESPEKHVNLIIPMVNTLFRKLDLLPLIKKVFAIKDD